MTRIIAGEYGGRRIQTPKGDGTRPTSDRVREALFSSLESELGGFDAVLRVLDLFAGSGALGLEALSRGASSATFVESDGRAAAVIKQNVADLRASGHVLKLKAERFVELEPPVVFDLIFIDPPYVVPTDHVASLVTRLNSRNTEPDALFVVERATRDPFAWPEGVCALRHKTYGETTLWFGRSAVRSLT